jgi:hypothetical protein
VNGIAFGLPYPTSNPKLKINSWKLSLLLIDVGLNHRVFVPVLNAAEFGFRRMIELWGPAPKKAHLGPHGLIWPLTKYTPVGKYRYRASLGKELQLPDVYIENKVFKQVVLSVTPSPTMSHTLFDVTFRAGAVMLAPVNPGG